MLINSVRKGYVFLVSVLAIGAIASATTVSMLLLGLAAEQSGGTMVESARAWEHAQTCVERAISTLRSEPTYIGEQTFTLSNGTCRLFTIGGSGNENRTVCAEGISGVSTRRIEVKVQKLLPTTLIDTWRETLDFTLCR